MTHATEPAIVLGVDGSEANRPAVDFAVDLALMTGQPLRMLAAYKEPGVSTSRDPDPEGLWTILARTELDRVRETPRLRVSTDLRAGDATGVLLDAAKDQAALVLGKRGLGTFARLLLGSTSTACAGRATAPVYVVPTSWSVEEHRQKHVLVGVDIAADEDATLAHAFAEAQRRGVALKVVYVIDIEPLLVWDPSAGGLTYRYWENRDQDRLVAVLAPWREEFPEVVVSVHTPRGNAAGVLIERATSAQLLVIGRHRTGPFGFGLGSQARTVLHYSETPVLVVPAI